MEKKDRIVLCVLCVFLFPITGIIALIYQIKGDSLEMHSRGIDYCYTKRDKWIKITFGIVCIFLLIFCVIKIKNISKINHDRELERKIEIEKLEYRRNQQEILTQQIESAISGEYGADSQVFFDLNGKRIWIQGGKIITD